MVKKIATANAKQAKKPTAAQMESRLRNAVIHIDKTKDTQSVYFDDKGLRLTVDSNEGYAIIATNFHRHVFDMVTSSGISRPFLYTKRFVELALENDCTVKDANGNITRSYAKLMSILKDKKDNTEYSIAWYCDLFFLNIFAPLYDVGESQPEAFLTYERYCHNVARNAVLFEERNEDVTNKQFVEKILNTEKELFAEMKEDVVFKAKTDEQFINEEVEALQQQEQEKLMEGNSDA